MIKRFKTTLDQGLECIITLPKKTTPHQKLPTILFLHGAGERGSDINLVMKHGIPKIALSDPDFPFITISPQCPKNEWWNNKFELLRQITLKIIEDYNGDMNRIYLTGLSMGGYGSWHMAAEYPQMFAAVVPICGGVFPLLGFPDKFMNLTSTPIWAFHGEKDDVVSVDESKKVISFLKKEGGNVKLTTYPDLKHDSWTITYDNPELYTWLLKQHL